MSKALARRQDACPIPPELYDAVIADLARFSEKIFTEEHVKQRHHFTEADWAKLDCAEIIEAVENEKLRRIRNGSAKRERAQHLIVDAPNVAHAIMMNAITVRATGSMRSKHSTGSLAADPTRRQGTEKNSSSISILAVRIKSIMRSTSNQNRRSSTPTALRFQGLKNERFQEARDN